MMQNSWLNHLHGSFYPMQTLVLMCSIHAHEGSNFCDFITPTVVIMCKSKWGVVWRMARALLHAPQKIFLLNWALMRSNVHEPKFHQSIQKLFSALVAPVVPVGARAPWKSTSNDGRSVMKCYTYVPIVILYVRQFFVEPQYRCVKENHFLGFISLKLLFLYLLIFFLM